MPRPLLGVWDIIGDGSTDFALVQVKTRDWPGSVETEKPETVSGTAQLPEAVHRWRDRQRNPDMKEL